MVEIAIFIISAWLALMAAGVAFSIIGGILHVLTAPFRGVDLLGRESGSKRSGPELEKGYNWILGDMRGKSGE